ncbi:hypothetical protein [Cytobacillus sp.]|uniref:hypothetical protein n=1 Tax=Cytobacillus sp. TaxID=2675269 RepID=UPI0028BDDD8A|nr:hypothetical protein [Cytobacillus sp.]
MKSAEQRENLAIARLEDAYLRIRRDNINISLEDIEDSEWMWSNKEIAKLDRLWELDVPMKRMAVVLGRTEIAVFFQVLDRLYKGAIKPREDWRIW